MAGEEGVPVDNPQIACLALFGGAAVALLWYAMQQTDRPVPNDQSESQMLGANAANPSLVGKLLNAGTVLDLRPEIHFWNPGDYGEDIQPVYTPHRYPTVSGGNISTVMHKGWSQACRDSPQDNDWRIAPPEVAVL